MTRPLCLMSLTRLQQIQYDPVYLLLICLTVATEWESLSAARVELWGFHARGIG